MENEPHVCQPLITVVTVCYNAAATIEETIQSVINQTYPNIEYLIIDGASTDGTVDIIKRYQDRIAYWVSEPDKGIYDAMNKGIEKATGEWINFMNSGDAFYAPDVLEKVAPSMTEDVDVVYGDTEMVTSWGRYIRLAQPITRLREHTVYIHQSSFVRTYWMKKMPYNLNYRICADYDFQYKLYNQQHATFKSVNVIVSSYEAEQGVSSVHIVDLKKEVADIHGDRGSFSWKLKFMLWLMDYMMRGLVKNMLPKSWLIKIRRCKHC